MKKIVYHFERNMNIYADLTVGIESLMYGMPMGDKK
jgi:hypothetical protein